MASTVEPIVTPAPGSAESESSAALGTAQTRFYHAELDSLRFLAFLAVFILHVFPVVYPAVPPAKPLVAECLAWIVSIPNAGEAGVDLFFVLSSFLITELLLREYELTGKLNVWAFYQRRALRIWPLYFFFLLLAPLLDLWLGGKIEVAWPYWLGFATFTNNWLVSIHSERLNTVAVPLWTVAIEEQFYLAWPLLVFACKPKRLVYLAAAIVALAWGTRIYLGLCEASDLTITRNTFARLDAIGIGALVCLGYRQWGWNFSPAQKRGLGLLGLALIVGGYRFLKVSDAGSTGPFSTPLLLGLWAIGGGLLLLAVYNPRSESTGLATFPWLVDLGKISYGLYVWHVALIAVIAKLAIAKTGTLPAAMISLLLSIAVASLSYRYLERPFLTWKSRLAKVASRD